MERRPRLLLADDHPLMLEGLRRLLDEEFEIVGIAQDGRSLVELAERRRPDVIIADISMPLVDGLEATRRLQDVAPEARVLILSIHGEPWRVREAFESGASGYLTKASAPDEIETAVRELLKGHCYLSPAITRAVVATSGPAPREEVPRPTAAGMLTPREDEIVRLVGKGLSNKEIAHRLGVSVPTVRTHLNKVYEKMGLASRVELALFAAGSKEAA